MPHLPENARLWLERAEIDYIGPFVKAWASFNAWYRHASNNRKDFEGLRYVKQQPNPVRNGIMPLLRSVQRDANGEIIPDPEPAQKFKLLVRDLHVCLDSFHIEVLNKEQLERISFRSICLQQGVTLPRSCEAYGLRYRIEKLNGRWKSLVISASNSTDVRACIEQETYDIISLQSHQDYGRISKKQRATLLAIYSECNPRPLTDLVNGQGDIINASDVEFRCSAEELFTGLIQVIYAMRNALLHGDLQPHPQAFAAYEPAYRIVMHFLGCLRS